MKRRLQEIAFSGIFGVEQLKQLQASQCVCLSITVVVTYAQDELMVNVLFGDVRVEILALDES